MVERLTRLEPGMRIVYGGDRFVTVTDELAQTFQDGDRLVVVQDTGDLLHVSHEDWSAATAAVDAAAGAFAAMGTAGDDQVTDFYLGFASHLEDDQVFALIAAANHDDVESARARGRSTTRLALTDTMRRDMIDGLRMWAGSEPVRGRVIEEIEHEGWRLDQVVSGLGVIAFVFEGRPNVLADGTGVLRAGNTVVFRIGSDALGTALATMEHAVVPAIESAGLPPGVVSLVEARSHAAGWALFSDPRIALAVARGSGAAVTQLGAVARQSGTPVSLHGTGGAWIVVAGSAKTDELGWAIYNSLDQKVCNTVNTVCIVESRKDDLIPVVLDALDRAGRRNGVVSKLHVTESAAASIPEEWFESVTIARADGDSDEPRTSSIGGDELGTEWEWERSPEVTLTVVPDVQTAICLFNEQSPHFIASLISSDDEEQRRFFELIDAPFVGNGFTRWVDGQFALDRPELGLSNWQSGRLFGRGGILSGDSAMTIRSRAVQEDPGLGRS